MASTAAGQTPVGALAINESQGDQYGWAVDYETAAAADQGALSGCGAGCSVVLTFERCAAYAADQDAGSTVYGWAESYDSASGASQRALAECGKRGSGCTVPVWGCNGSVVEAGPGLDRAARRQVQEGLQAAGFDPDGADGMFGPRTRSAIRSWQMSRGARATGYLDSSSMSLLRPSVAGQPTFREREPAGAPPVSVMPPSASLAASVAHEPRPASAEQDGPRRAGDVFLDCGACPEMVVLAGGGLAMGRFEVTVGEYRAFASATGGGAGGGCITYGGDGDSWRNPGFSQTDHHPVMCVSWDDAQEYLSWLSRTTGATYRLPTESEWERAAVGSPTGCGGVERRTAFFAGSGEGTCAVGSNGINAAGLYDMVGNAWEWMSDCWEGDCGRRVVRGSSWYNPSAHLRPSARGRTSAGTRVADQGFRVLRTLD